MHRSPKAMCVLMLIVVFLFFSGIGMALAQEATQEATQEVTMPETTKEASPEATVEVTKEVSPPTATTQPTTAATTYVVRPGDNLFRIALRFGTTVSALAAENGIVNPSLIFSGQTLRIPGTQPPQAASPTPAAPPATQAPPTANTLYTVRAGDTLLRIAIRNTTTINQLLAINNIPNPNIIYVGQQINIPGSAPSTTAPAATEVLTSAPIEAGFAYGIQLFPFGVDVNTLAAQAAQVGFGWVKVEVRWKELELSKGQINFGALDPIVSALEAQKFNILFTVTTAPAWARTTVDEDGPPDNFDDFGAFVGALAQRYAGRVAAYEIWNEPNLRREWNSKTYPIRADHYVNLLNKAHTAIKAADSKAMVVSAGLAPTGFNDGVNAINDRVFLQDMYSNNVVAYSDAIGAHPNGWANPPDATCCEQSEGVLTHYNDRSFYFKDTLNDYRQIMLRNNDASTPIWVTKFGWGTSEDTDAPGQPTIFVSYTSLAEQAAYIPRGFKLGAELGFVGPMFLYNLNGCQTQTHGYETCYYSLLDPNATARPFFGTLQALNMPKTGSMTETDETSSTTTSEETTTTTDTMTDATTPEETPQVTPEAG